MEGLTIAQEVLLPEQTVLAPTDWSYFVANVRKSLQQYFSQLDGEEPLNLYNLVVAEVEMPLLKVVLRFCNGNQSKAAKILGMSRGTLRKKLALYDFN